jgi:hypothetical protein
LALALFRTVFVKRPPASSLAGFTRHRRPVSPTHRRCKGGRDKLTLDGSAVASPSYEDSAMADGLDLANPLSSRPRAVGRDRCCACTHYLVFKEPESALAASGSFARPARPNLPAWPANTRFCTGGAPAYPHRAAVTNRF